MASVTDAKTIIDKASILLGDVTPTRWLPSELLGWLNDGQLELVILAPAVNTRNVALLLVAGVKQALPADGITLIDIPYNSGSAGTTMGTVINHVPKEIMLKRIPGWTTTMASGTVKHYIYSANAPDIFYVYPPQPAAPKYVECVYSARPVLITAATDGIKITIDDFYQNALLDYVLYRALSKDSEYGNQDAKAMAHYQLFIQAASINAPPQAPTPPQPKQAA
jgi:hypothetical protein